MGVHTEGVHHVLELVGLCHLYGVSGRRAAATFRPSSESMLYVAEAFRYKTSLCYSMYMFVSNLPCP
jgi:hypothetical protein